MAKNKSRKLSPAVLRKLSGYGMATGVVTYTPEIEVEVEGASIDAAPTYLEKEYCPNFELQLPSNKEYKRLRKAVRTQSESGEMDEIELMTQVVTKAIIGWDNYYDLSTGEPIEYDPELKPEISQKLMGSIFSYIAKVTGLI